MTKRELIEELSRKTILPKKEMEKFLRLLLQAIIESLREGTPVQLIPFGTFTTQIRSSRVIKNPRTGLKIEAPSKKVPIFRPGRMLRTAFD
jgi:nucleoid DNA-binding protein